MWMRRVLQEAAAGKLDVKGIFELSSCLANEMPKVQAHREVELTAEGEGDTSPDLGKQEFGKAR